MQPYDEGLIAAYSQRQRSDDDFPFPKDVEWITDNLDRLELRFITITADRSNFVRDHMFDSRVAAWQALGSTKGQAMAILVVRD
jgi:hypothetical protein